MELNGKTKINDLLNHYPFLFDFLITLSPAFKNLKNPVILKTMGRVATIEKAANIGGLKVESLISSLKVEIERQTGTRPATGMSGTTSGGKTLTDPGERQEALKGIIKDLHDGGDMEELKQRFRTLVTGVEASEIGQMEQVLMDEGLPPEEIKRLCDVHVEIFKEALEEQDRLEPPPVTRYTPL